MSSIRSILAAGILATALTGCPGMERLDASSYSALNASMNKARATLSEKDRKRFDESRRKFNELYFGQGEKTPRRMDLPDWHVVDQMTASEFHSFILKLKPKQTYEPGATFPDGVLAERLLKQYEWEFELLTGNRQRIIDSGRNTEDQYPIVDFAYVPPTADVPFEFDKASFLVTMKNASGYDAYNPTIRITITKPGDQYPVLERTFKYAERKPIEAGESQTMKFECCGVALDPVNNKVLKELTLDSEIKIDVLSVMNHTNLDLLNRKNFTMANSRRLEVLARCIKRIKADPANWVPYAEADQPGGCGDPNQAQNLLAMWKEQGVTPPAEFAHFDPAYVEAPEVAAAPTPVTTVNEDGTKTTTIVRTTTMTQTVANATDQRLHTTRAQAEASQASEMKSLRTAAATQPPTGAQAGRMPQATLPTPQVPAAQVPTTPSAMPQTRNANRAGQSLLPQTQRSEPLLGSGTAN